MEQMTLGQILGAVSVLAATITGCGVIAAAVKRGLSKMIEPRLTAIEDRIARVDMEACKNYLVGFLSDVERGDQKDEIEKARFWEQYQHYTEAGGNSYIKQKVDKLRKENRL